MVGIRSFVLRQGRMTRAQTWALEHLWSQFGIDYQAQLLDLDTLFGRRNHPKILEIGFGMGEATAHIAQLLPHQDFLVVDVHAPGVGRLLNRIATADLSNIRVMRHDAVEVLQQCLPDASLDGVHIFFPDPWSKKRHHKRRLLQAPFVALLCQKLKPKGYIHIATDWQDYAESILTLLSHTPQLENTSLAFAERPNYRPLTKFEVRGIALGHAIWDVVFRRR